MLVDPAVTDLLKVRNDRYALISMTSKRARQLNNGAKKLTDKVEYSNVTTACHEVFEGTLKEDFEAEELEKEENKED